MDQMTLKAEPRTPRGTRVAQAERAVGRLPGVIYGHGEPPEHVSLACHDVEVALAHGARTLAVELSGKAKQYLIKEVQYDSLGDAPIHVDLARVDLDERVRVQVGVELRGIPKGVSEGGVLDQHMADIEVECLVAQIPETLRPRVAELGLGDVFLVRDLELPPGVVALADGGERVASVHAVMEAPEPEVVEEAEEESAQPERIGRVRKEEDEETKKGGS